MTVIQTPETDAFAVAIHELKTPLGAVMLSIELLERQLSVPHLIDPVELRETLGILKCQGGILAHRIDGMLKLSRLTNSVLEIELEPTDLCDLVQKLVLNLRVQVLQENLELELDPCHPVQGYWDSQKLRHSIENLIINAIKYGNGKPIYVSVIEAGGEAVVRVRDQGIGIRPEDLHRIFERFERATPVNKRSSLGIGLYITRSVVEAHGGRIEVESEPGQGSTFTLSLPKNVPVQPE